MTDTPPTQAASEPSSRDQDAVSRDDLRRHEARLDARLQEVAARLVLHDGRFAAMTDRLNQADRRADALSARVDARLRAIDHRFDTLDTRLGLLDVRLKEWQEDLEAIAGRNRAAVWRATATGVGVTVLVNLVMLGGTLFVVL